MAANPSGQGFQNKNRSCNLGRTGQRERTLLKQNQSSKYHPRASTALSETLNMDFQDGAEQQHTAAGTHTFIWTLQNSRLDVRILFFPFYLTRIQNKEYICNQSDFIISNAKATINQCYTNYDSEFWQTFKFCSSLKERYI